MTESISFSVFTYCELHLFLFFMIAYMMVRILIAGRTNHINSYKYLAVSYASYGLTMIFDMLFTLMEYFEAEKPFTFKLIIILWYFFGVMGCLFWFIYTDLAEGTGLKKNTGLVAFAFLPAALNVCFILIPVLSEHYFFVSGDSNYSRGDWFLLYSVLNGFYLVLVPVLALIRIFRSKHSRRSAINYIFILFSLPISLSELLQQGTDRNFRCLGITLSLLVTYSYLNNLGEKRRINLVEGLTTDFDEVFVVDVDEDTVIPIVRDNKKGIGEIKLLHLKGNSYTKNVVETIAYSVTTDERDKVLKEFDREWVYEQLKTKIAVSSIFRVKNIGNKDRYYHAKFGRLNGGGGRKFILGIRDADAETRSQMDLDASELLKNDIIKVLSADYIGLFFFNLKDPDERINSIIPIDTNEGFTLVGNDKTVSEVFGKYLKYFVHPDDRRLIKYTIRYDNIERVLADKRRHSVTFRRKFGEDYKYVEMMIAKVEDEKKPPLNIAIGFSLVDEEYRERLSKDDELKDALLKADQASDSKTEFLFNMSHDIRTPMNAIKGFTELAIRHIDDSEKVTDYLNKIQKSEEHLLELINNILDMARVEKGQLKGDTKQINILELVDSMADMNQADAEIKKINFINQKKNIRNTMVYADELHLSQILMNILSNAIKYTQKGSVTFTTRELKNSDKGYATYEFVVEDTGIGMSGEFLDKIFDSFSRERNSTVSGIQGTGLGMAIVKRLVDYLEGDISIESTPDVGTRVSVILKFKISEYNEKAKRTRNSRKSVVGKKILVVEDNDLNREIIVSILREEGVEPEEAVNGLNALNIIKSKGPGYYSAILMDIQMPVMGGYEATAEIRRMDEFKNLPIIALSANAFEEDKKKSMKAGMSAHIAKPINVKELMETLKKSAI